MKTKLHVDFHNHPNICEFTDSFNAREFAETVSSLGVDSVNVFIKCNNGYCYFPSEIGIRYPYLKTDLLGDITRECHKNGVRVIGYINVALDYEGCIQNTDWLCRMCNSPSGNPFSVRCCLYSDYADYLITLVKEAVEKYPLDGIFADNLLISDCNCVGCKGKLNTDITLDFAKRLKEAVGNLPLEIKGLPYSIMNELADGVYIPVMPKTDGYDTYPVIASYLRTKYENVYYLDGRFLLGWGDFGGRRNSEGIANDMQDALIYGTSFCLGDHMDAVSGLNRKMYSEYEKTFSEYNKTAKLLSGKKIKPKTAILAGNGMLSTDTVRGCVKMLSELKCPFDIIDEFDDKSNYDLLIATPSYLGKTDKTKAKLIATELAIAGTIDDTLEFFDTDNLYYETENGYSSLYARSVKIKSENAVSHIIEPRNETGVYTDRPMIYAPPKCKASEYCATVVNENQALISFDIFSAYYKHSSPDHRQTVKSIIKKLTPNAIIDTDLNLKTVISLYEGDNEDVLLIKSTYPDNNGDVFDFVTEKSGKKISLNKEYKKAENATVLKSENGKTELLLPEINGFCTVILKK